MIVTWLESTARALVASGRGLLAADESHAPIEKRFAALGIESTVDNRRVDRGSRQRWSRSSHSPTP